MAFRALRGKVSR